MKIVRLVTLNWDEFCEREPEKADQLRVEYHGLEASYADLVFRYTYHERLSWSASDKTGAFDSPWFWDFRINRWVF